MASLRLSHGLCARSHGHAYPSTDFSHVLPAAFQLRTWDVQIPEDAGSTRKWAHISGARAVLSQSVAVSTYNGSRKAEPTRYVVGDSTGGDCGRLLPGARKRGKGVTTLQPP